MNISIYEAEICKHFHDEWFTLDNIKQLRKPNNITALKSVSNSKQLQKLKIILSLYYFRYWKLEFADKAPQTNDIIQHFKQYD
jgi:hypothetical protein